MTTDEATLTTAWEPIIDTSSYDLSPELRPWERRVLAGMRYHNQHRIRVRRTLSGPLERCERLITPVEDVLRVTGRGSATARAATACKLLLEVHDRGTPYWAWSAEEWSATIEHASAHDKPAFRAVAYLIGHQHGLHTRNWHFHRRAFAHMVFGREPVESALRRVEREVATWGFATGGNVMLRLRIALCDLMLRCGSPRLEDLTAEAIAAAHTSDMPPAARAGLRHVTRYLVTRGLLAAAPIPLDALGRPRRLAEPTRRTLDGVPPEWGQWCQRWASTTTLAPTTRVAYYYELMKVGRWLAENHPEAVDPAAWTRQIATEWVAAVRSMRVGDWSNAIATARFRNRLGTPLSARSRAGVIVVVRTFFRDCQEWEWIPNRFDPNRALATPRSIYALIGPRPRVIADDIWAKLLWAGLNLTRDDVGSSPLTGYRQYPFELVRAVAILWLFAGLRSNEIARLPVGCIRWQRNDCGAAGAEPTNASVVCLLDVPVNKTSTSFTKPVDRTVGEAIAAWEAVRPTQPQSIDPKTGAAAAFLFSVRGRRISVGFINHSIVGLLCRKANVPTEDARGAITSHRARSTIATQLYNAKDPMSLFELQAWLGHRSPSSTQAYTKITPATLAKAYTDAGYFQRNVRVIEVLVDRDAVHSGAAASGTPWQHYDLGHGYCTYDFFAQCPHRMACARCDFYVPKDSAATQLLEAKAGLQRMLVQIPLMDDERAAVENDKGAVDRLLNRLADVPTPAGPTPRALGDRRPVRMLPMANASSPGAASDPRPTSSDIGADPRSHPR